MIEAFNAIDTILAIALIAFAAIATGLAFLTLAAGYWTAVLIGWAIRTTTHRTRKETR